MEQGIVDLQKIGEAGLRKQAEQSVLNSTQCGRLRSVVTRIELVSAPSLFFCGSFGCDAMNIAASCLFINSAALCPNLG